MKSSATWLLVALCLCTSTAGLSAEQDANTIQGNTENHLRALRDPELAVAPGVKPTTVVNEANAESESKRAIHRVYDPKTGLYCEFVGDCYACPVSEKDEVYCRETSHRQELNCFKTDAPGAQAADVPTETRFQSCTPLEKAHPVMRVLTFEIMMAGLLAGAYTLLVKERRKHLSAFDLRKDPRQRSTLLGDKNDD